MNWRDTTHYSQKADELTNEQIVVNCKAWKNRQLEDSDWTQLPDVVLPNKDAWTKYRQDLRSLTKQGPDPKLWVFPEPPQ